MASPLPPSARAPTAISVVASPTFLFYALLVVSVVITVAAVALYDKTRVVADSAFTHGTLAPFPNAYPQVLPPPSAPVDGTDPTSRALCFQLCADETGAMHPCPQVAIRPCVQDADCAACDAPSEYKAVRVTCQKPSDEVARDQAALGNVSDKYCLIQKQSCDKAGDGSDLLACTTNADCVVCDDLDGSAYPQSMVCQYVDKGATISSVTRDGSEGKTFSVPKAGSYCLPKLKKCSSTTGSAVWTSEGWQCRCDKFGSLFGGEDCTQLQACSNHLVTGWSQDKQTLLLNRDAPSGAKTGDPWTPQTGVDPLACHDPDTGLDASCDTSGAQRNTVCQCDGLSAGSYSGFTYDVQNPHACVPDPCSANIFAGRTVTDARDEQPRELFAMVYYFNDTKCSVFGWFAEDVTHWSVAALVVYAVDASITTVVELKDMPVKDTQPPGALGYSGHLRDVRFAWRHGNNTDDDDDELLVFAKLSQNLGKARHAGETPWVYVGVLTADVHFVFGDNDPDAVTADVVAMAPTMYANPGTSVSLPHRWRVAKTYPELLVGLYTLFDLAVTDANGALAYPAPTNTDVLCSDLLKNGVSGAYLTLSPHPVGYWGLQQVGAALQGAPPLDPAFDPALADVGYIYRMFHQPSNACVCSGADSTLWTYDRNAVGVQNGFAWTGRCVPFTIPNSAITLPGAQTYSRTCAIGANTSSGITGVLPGVAFDSNGKPFDICAADPCTGTYTDPFYNVPASDRDGSYNAFYGRCDCGNVEKGWSRREFTEDECNAMRADGTNPVCSACVNACRTDRGLTPEGDVAGENCPVYWDKTIAAGCESQCRTRTDGSKYCDCPTGCVELNGTCLRPADGNACCQKYYPVFSDRDSQVVCSDPKEQCRQVLVYRGSDSVPVGHILQCREKAGDMVPLGTEPACFSQPVAEKEAERTE